jgi:hypothetical protein
MILLFGCSDPRQNDNQDLAITNFQHGKLRESSIQGIYEIYDSGKPYKYQVNGSCTYPNGEQPCMKIGYSFNYNLKSKSATLNCNIYSQGNMKYGSSFSEKDNIHSYQVELKQEERYYIQFQALRDDGEPMKKSNHQTICKYNGKVVIDFTQEFIP